MSGAQSFVAILGLTAISVVTRGFFLLSALPHQRVICSGWVHAW